MSAQSEAARPKRWTESLFNKLAHTLNDASRVVQFEERPTPKIHGKNIFADRTGAAKQVTPSPVPPVTPPTVNDARESVTDARESLLAVAVSPKPPPHHAPLQRRRSLQRVHIEPEHVREVCKIAADSEAARRCAALAALRGEAPSLGDAEAPGPGWPPSSLGPACAAWAESPRLATIEAPRRGDAYGETGHSSRRADEPRRWHSDISRDDCVRVAPAFACEQRPSLCSQRLCTPRPTTRLIGTSPQLTPRAADAVAGLRRRRSDSNPGAPPPPKRSNSSDALQELANIQQEFLDARAAEGRAAATDAADAWATEAWLLACTIRAPPRAPPRDGRPPLPKHAEGRDLGKRRDGSTSGLSALAGCALAGLGQPLDARDDDEFADIDNIEDIFVF
ncbi:hypothetical protein M885DRAFT_591791 [Pelagophyceae sp. CCMP2097]|nr:hypothetical protein M885DRAFT_591791 [Pelagophyceae sp. CCMP2097]